MKYVSLNCFLRGKKYLAIEHCYWICSLNHRIMQIDWSHNKQGNCNLAQFELSNIVGHFTSFYFWPIISSNDRNFNLMALLSTYFFKRKKEIYILSWKSKEMRRTNTCNFYWKIDFCRYCHRMSNCMNLCVDMENKLRGMHGKSFVRYGVWAHTDIKMPTLVHTDRIQCNRSTI